MFPTFFIPSSGFSLELFIENHGFEDPPQGVGIMPPGWTNNLPGTSNPYAWVDADAPEGGAHSIGGQLGDGVMQIHQVIDLQSGANLVPTALIDAGLLEVTATFWAGSLEKGTLGPTGNDQPKLTLRFLNGASAEISTYTEGYLDPTRPGVATNDHVFNETEYVHSTVVPALTRYIDIVLDGNLAGGGSGSDAMFDDIRLNIHRA